MSKELDNLELIRPMLVFDSDDDFYFLQILQRRKENDGIGANSRVIKNYYIRNVEYLDRRYEEIKALCTVFRARASIRLNRRSFRQVSGRMLVNMANSMSNESFDHGHKLWDKSCGQRAGKYKRTWVLDIDRLGPRNAGQLLPEGRSLSRRGSGPELERAQIQARTPDVGSPGSISVKAVKFAF